MAGDLWHDVLHSCYMASGKPTCMKATECLSSPIKKAAGRRRGVAQSPNAEITKKVYNIRIMCDKEFGDVPKEYVGIIIPCTDDCANGFGAQNPRGKMNEHCLDKWGSHSLDSSLQILVAMWVVTTGYIVSQTNAIESVPEL
ncbi:7988_t:CDS:2 [Acaulospora morrowiae]|uniref:7988_t:CDS:1 n=1 Tax=Acaulospora morrowiae TaxID=94023 RepID=A0A9N9FMY1_9GLOM|nr:7988_t:CDS:2 [Acaulospora morrowiae]